MKLKEFISIVPADKVAKGRQALMDDGVTALLREWAEQLPEMEVADMDTAISLVAVQQVAMEVADQVDLALKPAGQEQPFDIWVLRRHGLLPDYMNIRGDGTERWWEAKAMTEEEAKASGIGSWKAEPLQFPISPLRIRGTVLGALMSVKPTAPPVDAKALMASMLMSMQHDEDADDLICTARGWAARVGVTVPGVIGHTSNDKRNTAALVAQGAVDGDEWEAKS